MRRIFAIFALLCCGIAVTFAQVTVSPNPLYRGYQGKVTITFDPSQGNAGMEGATACYAHTGLITSESSGDSDWLFRPQSGWRSSDTPELIQDGTVWKLEINNIYTFYDAPLYTDIRKLAFVFHDGPSGDKMGKTATNGDIFVELADAPGTCSYSLEMRDEYNDGWDGSGYVTISEGVDYIFGHRISSGESPKTVSVPYFGGTPVLTWHDGSCTSENTIIIYAPSGAEMFKHDQGTSMSDGEVLYTMSENPCTKTNPYEITGLTASSLDQVNYNFTWNKNDNVDRYLIKIYDPNNQELFSAWKTSSDAMSYSCDLNASSATANGDFRIVVSPYNSSNELLSQGASKTFVGNLPNIGEVTVHLLIPSDCDIDLSQGISAYWSDEDDSHNGNAVLTQEGSTRWWTATMDVQAVSFYLWCATPAIDGIVRRTYSNGLYRQKDVYLELRTIDNKSTTQWYYSSIWNIDPATPDHNYNIVSLTPTGGPAKVSLEFELPQDTAYHYYVYLYRDGESSSWNDTDFGKSDITTNPYVLDWTFGNSETVHITRVEIRQYDSGWNPIGTPFEYTTPFDILPHPLAATNINAVHNPDGTYTISWDAMAGVDKFKAYFGDSYNSYIGGEEIITASTPPVGGRYSVTTSSPISPEGWCSVEIDSYTWDGSSYNYEIDAYYNFLSKVTVRVLVPDDNNMDITGGVYVGYWTPLYDIADHCIALTDNGSGWWSADIYVDAPSYSFLVANSNINSTWDQWSENIEDITSLTCCTELLFKTASKDQWPIQEGSCSASNHDYRITNVTVNTSNPSEQEISITVSQYKAFAFTVEIPAISVKESSISYNKNVSLYYSSPVDVDGTYSIAPINYDGDTLAATYTGTFTIPANPYIPTNPQAVVQSDGTTVDFSWTAPGTAPAKMIVTALSHSDAWSDWTYRSAELAGDAVSVSGTVLYSGVNEWYIDVYDASNNWLGYVQGPNFTTSSTADYSISNLNVAVSSMTATVTWTTSNPQINKCYWECFDEYDNYQGGSMISYTDGNWSVEQTLSSDGNYYWKVSPYYSNGSYNQLLALPTKTALIAIPGGAVQYTLTLTAGAGGSVSSNPAGTTFAAGADVEITATPDAGYVFDHWNDGNTNATRTITMDANKTFEATFALSGGTQYTLTLNAGAGGTVSATPSQATYAAGANVTITATPNSGYVFVQWNDGNTNASRSITMTGNLTYTATFDVAPPSTFTLTLHAEEGGTVSASPNQASYDPGATVTITATPNSGYHFDHWSDGNTSASRTITMDANKTFTAYFLSDTKYTVKISIVKAEGADELFGKIKVNDGTAKTSYNEQVYGLTVLTVTAVPDEGYTVNEWSDDDGIKSLEREIKITSDTTIKVSFREIKRYTLTVTVSPAKSGTVKLNGETRDDNKLTVQEGKSITVTASAAEGYKFKGWKDEDGELFETASEASVKMNRNKQITAVFEEAQGFESVKTEDVPAQKLLINGQLFILRDGKLYNAAGVLVK